MSLIGAQTFDFARYHQFVIVTEREAMLGCESFSALAYEVHMGTLAKNFASSTDRIANALHPANPSAPQGRSLHEESIELHLPVTIEKAAAACIKSLVVFERYDGFLHGVECGPALGQHLPARGDSIAHAVKVGIHHVIGNRPGTTVNYQNRISRQTDLVQK